MGDIRVQLAINPNEDTEESCCVLSFDASTKFTNFLSDVQSHSGNELVTGFYYYDEDCDKIIVNCSDDFDTFVEEAMPKTEDDSSMIKIFPHYGQETACDQQPSLTVAIATQSQYPSGQQASGTISETLSSLHPSRCSTTLSFCSTSGPSNVSEADHSPAADLSAASYHVFNTESMMNICINNIYLECEIGAGRFGQVLRGWDLSTGQVMAVKRIQMDQEHSEDEEFNVISELEILRACQSPYIIAFYGAFYMDSHVHICMELMDGYSLDRYGVLPEEVLRRIAVDVIQGLLYLWRNNVMHRDLKPSNVLINYAGEVKISDFNISTRMEKSIAQTFIGTYQYLAPERITQPEYRFSADIWSLGVCLYELASGALPYLLAGDEVNRLSMDQIMERIVQYREPSPLPPQLQPHLATFIYNCIKHDPKDRLRLENLLTSEVFQDVLEDGPRHAFVRDWLSSLNAQLKNVWEPH